MTAVKFGTTVGTGLILKNDTELSVISPVGTTGAKDVVVVSAGGDVTKTGGFTYA